MDTIRKNDIVYMGVIDHGRRFDCAFRVLDPDSTSTGGKGMFLLSENLVSERKGKGIIFKKTKKPYDNHYQDSHAREFLKEFFEERFYEVEKKAIIRTCKSDESYVKIHCWELLHDEKHKGEFPFVASMDILSHDALFPLSAEEADNAEYGFDDELNRIAFLDGKQAGYWLRSPHADDFPKDVGIVFHNGWLMDFLEDKSSIFHVAKICMRPALNLDTDLVQEKILVREDPSGYREWVFRYVGESETEFERRIGCYRYHRRYVPKKPLKKKKIPAVFRFFLTLFIHHVEINRVKKKNG